MDRNAIAEGLRSTKGEVHGDRGSRVITASPDDLEWWLAIAPSLDWIWASTYASSAPHSYVVHPRTPGLTRADYVRAGRVIRTFGEPGKYWSMTNLYLFTPDRRLKFWCMWGSPPREEDATLINMASTERSYGSQSEFDRDRLAELVLPPKETS